MFWNRSVQRLPFVSSAYTALAAVCLFTAQSVFATFDYTAWSHSKKFFLNTTPTGANVTGTVNNFPVFVRLNEVNFGAKFAECKSDGSDLRFESESGNPLDYEIEQWNPDNKTAAVWVKVGSVLANNGTQYITLYWGKADAAPASNGAEVFESSNNFKGVWHMNETPVGTGSIKDRTNNNIDGTPANMSASNVVDGTIGKCLDFDGVSESINLNFLHTYEGGTTFTFSAWIKCPSQSNTAILHGYSKVDSDSAFIGTSANAMAVFKCDRADGAAVATGTVPVADDQWHYIVGIRNGNTSAQVYTDGGNLKSGSNGSDAIVGSLNHYIGSRAGTSKFFKGYIDEVCISTTARGANWIKLCYENQKPDQTLVREYPVVSNTVAYPGDCAVGENMQVDGKVTIGAGFEPGTADNATNLTVTGKILCDGLQIKDWLFRQKTPDYVFKPEYQLTPLPTLEAFIKTNHHLPEVPSADEMGEKGLDLKEFNLVLLKKIEELTLHAIEHEKKIAELEKRVAEGQSDKAAK